jgi:predicted RNA binding protein YcfA (HicA-like mRNA interferase family)
MMASEKRFSEVKKMLEQAGYRLVRICGSHHCFVKSGAPLVSIPVHQGKVKPYYVSEVEKILREQEH